MMTDFRTQVRSAFAFLESERGFELERYDPPQAFYNASAEFQSPTVSVTVARERGQCYVNVGAPPVALKPRCEHERGL
jgi:hypothetical protein